MGTNALGARNFKDEASVESEKYSSSEDDISNDDCDIVTSRRDHYLPSVQCSTEESYVITRYSDSAERYMNMICRFTVEK
jgi:hypothetical protein